MANVQLKQIVKRFGDVEVIRGIDLDITSGELVVFVGPSGCGKSTLLRMIAGLETTTSGDIMIGETRVNDAPPRSRDIAMVFQYYVFYPHKSVYENMAFGLRLRQSAEDEIKRRVGDAAANLRIEHLLERKPRQLSGGQRHRVAVNRAIVRDPKAFLFDEPLSNLDAQLCNEMRTEINKLHARRGKTITYVTHDQVEAVTLADRIAVLSGGKVIQYATPNEIYNRPVAKFAAGFTGSPAVNFETAIIAADGVSARVGDSSIALPDNLRNANAAFRGKAVDLGIRPEDILVDRTATTVGTVVPETVVVTEPLGAETLVTLRIGGAEFVARRRADFDCLAAAISIYCEKNRRNIRRVCGFAVDAFQMRQTPSAYNVQNSTLSHLWLA